MRNQRLRSYLTSQPWALQERYADTLLDLMSLDLDVDALTQRVAANLEAAAPHRKLQSAGPVAVIQLHGVLSQHPTFFEMLFGIGSSTDSFQARFKRAVDDSSVRAIVVDVDSPGGSVYGTEETADLVRSARGAKPIVAVANSLMASAAYWIASAADEVVASPSADVGSIGVWMLHLDWSEALAAEGIKPTIIRAGKYKAEGNPYEPLAEEAREFLQGEANEAYSRFIASVASSRGVSAATVKNDFGEGRVLNARQAKAAGMVDAVEPLDAVIRRMGGEKNGVVGMDSRRAAAAEPELEASTSEAEAARARKVLNWAVGIVEPDDEPYQEDEIDEPAA